MNINVKNLICGFSSMFLLTNCLPTANNQEQSKNDNQQKEESFQKKIDKAVDDAVVKAEQEQKAQGQQEERQVENSTPELTLKAEQLWEDYKANEISADREYKGKILQVVGYIKDIGKDIFDEAYITLSTDEMFGSIQCFFNKDQESKLAQLTKGQYATVVGKCNGKTINVCLKRCRVN